MPSPTTLVDAHVHFHSFFDRRRFLDGAAANFESAARGMGLDLRLGVLLLTEIARTHAFEGFRDSIRSTTTGPWRFEDSGEENSVYAVRDGSLRLLVVAGRQQVTAEGLEVLALGTTVDLGDGMPVRKALAAVRESGGLPVIPWGAGKWWSRRGRLVGELIEEQEPSAFYLGDNGGRPELMRRPPLFLRGESRGIRVLPGSDPLPIAGEDSRVGTYGFVAEGVPDVRAPARQLFSSIRAVDWKPRPFGRGRPWGSFLRSQLAMQLRR